MASRRVEPARREEDVGESVTSSALLGFRSQLVFPSRLADWLEWEVDGTPLPESSIDGAPSGADAIAAPSNDTPTSIDHGSLPQMYMPYTPLGVAVTSSGGPIQVLPILFTPVLNHRLTPDSLHH